MLSRRAALFLLAAGLALPAPARAAPPRLRPRRFIGVFTPHGVVPERWRPGPGFDLRHPESTLAPFDDPQNHGRSFRDRLIVLEGLDLAAGIEAGTTGHDGSRVILTGAAATAESPSLDQYLALDLGLGLDTPHSSLVLGIGNDESAIGSNLSYGRDGTPIPKIIDPGRLFGELFGSPLAGSSSEALEQRRRRGRSALDLARAELAALRARAPAAERSKLEQHHDALREVEKRIAAVERTCPAPSAPAPFERVRAFGGGEPYFEAITQLQIDLLVRAMQCDLTRVATLYLADLSRTGLDPALPLDIHTDVAHRFDRNGPETWSPLARQHRHTYRHVAHLMQRLYEAGLLDDTLLLVSSDMGDPARHSSRDVPTLLAGAPVFPMGRHLDLKALEPLTRRQLVPNNRLLVSVARAFGAPIDRFGVAAEPEVVRGELTSL